jgi:hypothetical protein
MCPTSNNNKGSNMKYYRENPDLLESFIDFHQEENGCPHLGDELEEQEEEEVRCLACGKTWEKGEEIA